VNIKEKNLTQNIRLAH